MIRKVPIIGSVVTVRDIASALARSMDGSVRGRLESALSAYTHSRYIFLTNSGISAFYIILKALAAGSQRREVVLPAYTAGSLVVAVRKAGLDVVLCDVSLKDFNADIESMINAVSDRTLAVVPVHMFGIGMAGIAGLRERIPPEVYVLEDCCQSMGSAVASRMTGTFGDISFFSFNRGKNLSVGGGGCIAANSEMLSRAIEKSVQRFSAPSGHLNIKTPLAAAAFTLASSPYLYGLVYPLASYFKEVAPPLDISVGPIEGFHAAIAISLLKRFSVLASRRHDNGAFLSNSLKDAKAVTVPVPGPADRSAFSRYPVLFREPYLARCAAERLWASGIEASRMYIRPLHHMFELGYPQADFPNASYLAGRLLTLPSHPAVGRGDLEKMVDIIRGMA